MSGARRVAACASGWIVAAVVAAVAASRGGRAGAGAEPEKDAADRVSAEIAEFTADAAARADDEGGKGGAESGTGSLFGAGQYRDDWYVPDISLGDLAKLAMDFVSNDLAPERRVLEAIAARGTTFAPGELEALADDMAACTNPIVRDLAVKVICDDLWRRRDVGDATRAVGVRIFCEYATTGAPGQRQNAAREIESCMRKITDEDAKFALMKEVLCDKRDGAVNILSGSGFSMVGELGTDAARDERFLDLYEHACGEGVPEIARREMDGLFYRNLLATPGDVAEMRKTLEWQRSLTSEQKELVEDVGELETDHDFMLESMLQHDYARYLNERGEDGDAWYAAEHSKMLEEVRASTRKHYEEVERERQRDAAHAGQ